MNAQVPGPAEQFGASSNEPEAMDDASGRTFSARMVVWLAIVGVLSLAATLVVPVFSEDRPSKVSAENDAYSKSAVGHHAFAAFLQKCGLSVRVSRYRSGTKAGPTRPLLISEPDQYASDELFDLILSGLENVAPVVVVLPKWDESVELPGDRWIEGAELHPASVPGKVLAQAYRAAQMSLHGYDYAGSAADDVAASVRREAIDERRWTSAFEGAEAEHASLKPAQFVGSSASGLEPVVWADSPEDTAVLIGNWPNSAVFVVTDPDMINTMGLGDGDNAVLIYRFLAEYLGASAVVVDEVMHGYKKADSIWTELFEFPLILLTFHLLSLLALALWTAMARFGKPLARPPRVSQGKVTLIENTATLLALGGHVGHTLREYFATTLRAIAGAYALPGELDHRQRLQTLERLARQRGVDIDLADLEGRVAAVRDHKRESRRAVALARKIHRFRVEMIHGYRRDQSAHR